MQRHQTQPRENWQATVESQGMYYHTADGVPYWDESVYYEFRPGEIDQIEAATYALNDLCLKAVQHVIDRDRFDAIPDSHGIPAIHPPLVGPRRTHDLRPVRSGLRRRFAAQAVGIQRRHAHLAAGSGRDPVVLAPGRFPRRNTIQHDPRATAGSLADAAERGFGADVFRVAGRGVSEDFMNVSYLRDVAIQAGFDTAHINVEDIGWDAGRKVFTDLDEKPMRWCFKLYPWEWMHREEFGPHLLDDTCRWLEPPWKALLSNKAILPILWELFPESPYLLEARFSRWPAATSCRSRFSGGKGRTCRFSSRANCC